MNNTAQPSSLSTHILNKVPEVTLFFWIIKVLGTTVGETAADFLNVNLNFGLTATSLVTGVLLLIALFFQLREKKYVPSIYWSAVVLISVFGTLVTDNLTDSLGVPLETSTLLFSGALAFTFFAWYAKEKTLSIHAITSRTRELFYWLTILCTFALGTAAGDLMAEGLGLGYFTTGIIVAFLIAGMGIAWRLGLNAVLAFWIIYIFTRPLGASIGDLLSQPHKYGGLGLGATTTSALFVAAIIGAVTFLTFTKKDVTAKEIIFNEEKDSGSTGVSLQVAATLGVILCIFGAGYYLRQQTLQQVSNNTDTSAPQATTLKESPPSTTQTTTHTTATSTPVPASPLGNLSSFAKITQDTLDLVNQNNFTQAKIRVSDLEYEWDTAEARLKPLSKVKWTEVDDAIDLVLRQVRAVNPNQETSKTALEALLAALK